MKKILILVMLILCISTVSAEDLLSSGKPVGGATGCANPSPDYDVENLFDGDRATRWLGADACWCAGGGCLWGQIDLGDVYTITRMVLIDETPVADREIMTAEGNVAINYSEDNITWTRINPFTTNFLNNAVAQISNDTVSFTARYLKIYNASSTDGGGPFGARVSTWDIIGESSTPSAPVIEYFNSASGDKNTSDTTPLSNVTTDINADCNISSDNTSFYVCGTTGTTAHQCSVSAFTPLKIGYPQNVTVRCTADELSTYATIQYNITDGTSPTVALNKPSNGATLDYLDVSFNFTVTDNHFTTLSCNLTIDDKFNQTNASVNNGTLTNWNTITFAEGTYTWNTTCIDGHDNIGSDQRTFSISLSPINLSLSDYYRNIDVELGSTIVVNSSDSTNTKIMCVDIGRADYGINYSCASNQTVFNISIDDFLLDRFNDSTTSKSSADFSSYIQKNVTVAENLTQQEMFTYTMVNESMPGAIKYHIDNWSNVNVVWCYGDGGWRSYVEGRPVNNLNKIGEGWECALNLVDTTNYPTIYTSYFNMSNATSFNWTFPTTDMPEAVENRISNWSDVSHIWCNTDTGWLGYDTTAPAWANDLHNITRGWGCYIYTKTKTPFDLYDFEPLFDVRFDIDTRTDIDSVQLDITSSGTSENVIVNGKHNRGILTDDYLYDDEFYYSGIKYTSKDLVYSTSGIKTVYFNLSDHPLNLSFQLSGTGADVGNNLDYYDYYNTTSPTYYDKVGLDIYGYYENMEDNISGGYWSYTDSSSTQCRKTNGLTDDYLQLNITGIKRGVDSQSCSVVNSLDSNFDLKDYTKIISNGQWSHQAWRYSESASCGADGRILVTDGTNSVTIYILISGVREFLLTRNFNLTLNQINTQQWQYVYTDNTPVTYKGTKDLSTLNSGTDWYLKYSISADEGTNNRDCVMNNKINIYNIKGNGLKLNKSSTSAEYGATFGTFNSTVIANTSITHNYTAIYVDADMYLSENITFEFSSDNLTFEDVTQYVNTQRYIFTKRGNKLAYRINMSGTNESTPIVYNLNVQVIPTQVENVSVVFGSGISETFTYTGVLNSSNSPLTYNVSQSILQVYNSSYVSMTIETDTSGEIELKTVIINSTINPVVLNATKYEDCSNCYINISYDSDDITVDNLQVKYVGGNKTVNFTAHDSGNLAKVTYNVTYYYSGWNYSFPQYVDYVEFIPTTPTAKNVVPYKQLSTRPILNITTTNFNSKNMNFTILFNESSSCINDTISLTNTKSDGFKVTANNTWYNVSYNKPYNTNFGLWMWADYGCNRSTWSVFAPYMYLRGCCVGCDICSSDTLNTEII